MKKRETLTSVGKKLDAVFSRYIRERDKCCVRCGKTGRLECSHIVSRSVKRLRWAPENAKSLCHICHRWWHSHPVESAKWAREHFGDAHIDNLISLKNQYHKWTVPELKELLAEFKR